MIKLVKGFPDSSVGKESTCNAGDPGSVPELGRSYPKRERLPSPVILSWSSGNVEQMSQFFTSVAKVLEFELQRQSFQWENLLYLPLTLHIYSFFSFFAFLSTYLLVLFSLLYSPLGTLLYLCFPVFALVSFVLVDISFGFLCSPCWSIHVIYIGLFWFCLWVCMYRCIFTHTFYCCYKPLRLSWTFAALWSFLFFSCFSFFFHFFSFSFL